MALSPMPLNLQSSSSAAFPSKYLCIHMFYPDICSLKNIRAQKLRISCCQQTVNLKTETQERNDTVKKKRKPRPSFLEQIQDKWSLKTPSLRESFPWQEENNDSTNQELQALRLHASQDVSFRIESEKNCSVTQSVRSDVKFKPISAPWVHGNKPRKKSIESESRITFLENGHENKSLDGFHELCQNEEAVISVVQESEGLVKEVAFEGISKQKCGKYDASPIGTSEKNESLGNEEREVATFVKDSSTIYQNVSSMECFADANGLMRLPWEREPDKNVGKGGMLRKSKTELSERLIPEPELKRLRNVALRMLERMKVGAAGLTQALVDAIHEKWKNVEVVKLKFEGPPSKNMKRTHEILESRTGGLIIWRSGSSVVLYRGMAYKLDCVKSYSERIQAHIGGSGSSEDIVKDSPPSIRVKHLSQDTESSRAYTTNFMKNLSNEEEMALSELNLLLDELGPRFIDWSGREPLPVDADLLPAAIPGYRPPFRLLPHGTRQALRDKEMTHLRNTARTLPPHFALGRNRELQGLAMAMVKLWKKSAIAKIAIKRGVQNTSNERMAEELKILTGGTLLSRNKDYIVFYRGNDFLPPTVSSVLIEAEKHMALQQDEEEQARRRAAASIDSSTKAPKQTLVAGTLAETVAATSRWGNQPDSAEIEKMMRDSAIARHTSLVNSFQRKLTFAKGKIRKAEKALQKVQGNQEPANLPTDLETLTDEERCLFRKIGLSMKPYLLLGRREIFDGTIENMHLHWKYRELVKIFVDRKKFSQVKHIAVSLEAESGGVLVSVEKTTKGYAIIVYRGKNYQRPSEFRPKNLLTKRQALARSIELQRREALKHHVLELEEKVEKMKHELEDMKTANENDSENLDSSLDAASDDDKDMEMECETVYLHKRNGIKKYRNS